MTPKRQPDLDKAATERNRPVDASMTLLNEIMERPLDPGYAEASQRQAAGDRAGAQASSKIITIITLAALTALVTVAVIALRAPQDDVDEARTVLETNIRQRNDEYATRKENVEELEAEIRALQEQNLSLPGQRLLEASQRLGVTTGGTAVEGPGLVIEMRDAKPAAGESLSSAERVQDFDLQVVVNGLWAAGAEAISINDHRITTTSAIRSAGDAILVDFSPLQGPYVIEAIGEKNRLQTGMAANQAGSHLQLLSNTYNIGVSTKTSDHLEVPSGSDSVRYATMDAEPQDIPGILSEDGPQPSSTGEMDGGDS